eukprot:1026353-Lingulodinium_polyedra.AAC.1
MVDLVLGLAQPCLLLGALFGFGAAPGFAATLSCFASAAGLAAEGPATQQNLEPKDGANP